MHQTEIVQLQARLTELAEYYGTKPPTPASMKVYFDVLKPHALPNVLSVLTDWPRRNRKTPLADDIDKLCAERASELREAEAKKRAAETPTMQSVTRAARTSAVGVSYLRKFDAIRRLPKTSLWPWLLRERELNEVDGVFVWDDAQCNGAALCLRAKSMWREALGYRPEVPANQTHNPDERQTEQIRAHLAWRAVDVSDDDAFWAAYERVIKAHHVSSHREPGEEG
jgi:hypothetical protein